MSHIFKRFCSVLVALVLVLSLVPFGTASAETTWTEVGTADEFTAAVANGGNIRLTADITLTAKIELKKAAVIDFNGCTLTTYSGSFDSFYITSTVTFKDLSEEADGGVSMVGSKATSYQLIRVGGSGNLTIENGVYSIEQSFNHATTASSSGATTVYSWGVVTINGGTFSSTGGDGFTGIIRCLMNTDKGQYYINGGNFTATNKGSTTAYALRTEGSKSGNTVTVKGGTFSATANTGVAYGFSASGTSANLTVPSDANAITVTAVSNVSVYGIENRGIMNLHSPKLSVTATSNVTGTTEKYAYGIWNGRSINVTAGTFKGLVPDETTTKAQGNGYCNSRIDASNVGTGTLSGGTFYGSAVGPRGSGIVVTYSNALEITGNVKATGSGKALWVYRGNATVSGGTFSSDNTSYCVDVSGSGVATITGGTFEIANAKNLVNSGSLTITGGTFKSRDDSISNTGTLSITGGSFVGASGEGMVDVYPHLDTAKYSQDYYGNIVAAGTVAPRFEVTIGDTVTQYESLTAMTKAVNTDGTGNAKIKLLCDLFLGDSMGFTASAELDLNGYTWLQTNQNAVNFTAAGTEKKITKIHDGMVIHKGTSVPIAVSKGAMQLENLTVYGCSTMPVCYYETTGNYNADNFVKNCNLITNRYFVFSYRTSGTTGQQDLDVLIEDTNLVNMYSGSNAGEIFYAGSKATTGQYTLGKGVNMYHVYKTDTLARQSGDTAGTAAVKAVAADGYAIHDRVDAASYANINALLAQIGAKTGFTEGQVVYGKDAIWTTSPTLYKRSTEHTYANGSCSCGATQSNVAKIGDTTFNSLSSALEAATDGQTVTLLANVGETDLLVPTETTLDLNGNTVTAASLTVYGNLIDGAKGGDAVIISDSFHVSGTGYLPIYDATAGGYRIYNYTLGELGSMSAGENAVKFGFRLNLTNTSGYALLAKGADSGISANLSIALGGAYTNTLRYDLKAATLAAYGEALAAGKTTWAIQLTIKGVDVLGENGTMTMAPTFASTSGMKVSGNGTTWSAATA